MNIEFYKTSEKAPPKDGRYIVGVFNISDKFFIETCRYKFNSVWQITEDDFFKEDPIMWTKIRNFTNEIYMRG